MTEIRFNPYRLRRLGLSSTQEAKILWYLSQNPCAERKALGRLFDLRLVERLERIGRDRGRGGGVLGRDGRPALAARAVWAERE